MTKISVIIPLFNSAPFLPSLFNNIRQQSIAADVEFVFVDDHGEDDSLAIAHALADKSRLNCVFGETAANGGPGAARNAGLAIATGEYVAFMDCDDALDPQFCELLYDAAWTANADLAYCHILAVEGSRKRTWRNPIVETGAFFDDKRLYFFKNYKSYFTSFIYRRKMIISEGICFPATRSAEDSCFLAEALLCGHTIASVNKPLYHYQLRPDSVSSMPDDGRYLQRLQSFDTLLEFARKKGLYGANKEILDYLYIKKATAGALRDQRKARRVIIAHTKGQIPGWRRNILYRRDLRLRAAILLIR